MSYFNICKLSLWISPYCVFRDPAVISFIMLDEFLRESYAKILLRKSNIRILDLFFALSEGIFHLYCSYD